MPFVTAWVRVHATGRVQDQATRDQLQAVIAATLRRIVAGAHAREELIAPIVTKTTVPGSIPMRVPRV